MDFCETLAVIDWTLFDRVVSTAVAIGTIGAAAAAAWAVHQSRMARSEEIYRRGIHAFYAPLQHALRPIMAHETIPGTGIVEEWRMLEQKNPDVAETIDPRVAYIIDAIIEDHDWIHKRDLKVRQLVHEILSTYAAPEFSLPPSNPAWIMFRYVGKWGAGDVLPLPNAFAIDTPVEDLCRAYADDRGFDDCYLQLETKDANIVESRVANRVFATARSMFKADPLGAEYSRRFAASRQKVAELNEILKSARRVNSIR